MSPIILLVEGADRVGKTTFVELLKRELDKKDYDILTMHPNKGIRGQHLKPENNLEYIERMNESLKSHAYKFQLAKARAKALNRKLLIIHDRGLPSFMAYHDMRVKYMGQKDLKSEFEAIPAFFAAHEFYHPHITALIANSKSYIYMERFNVSKRFMGENFWGPLSRHLEMMVKDARNFVMRYVKSMHKNSEIINLEFLTKMNRRAQVNKVLDALERLD